MSSANCAEVPGGKDLASMISKLETTDFVKAKQTVENSERDRNTTPPDLPLEKSICRSGGDN